MIPPTGREKTARQLCVGWRTVCADLEEIGDGAALAIVGQACLHQKEILVAAISRQAAEHSLEKAVVAARTGEGLQDLCEGNT